MIPGLEILNLHAQGGMAEVYRARGKGADGRTWMYAVKRILPEFTADPELRKMFAEEARIASNLIHPNIVRVYDLARSDDDEFFIVMEFLEGRDLAEAIDTCNARGRKLPVWLAIHCAREVLQALAYATTQARDKEGRLLGLIHRDISPHNIFVCFDGAVKLTDFGVAKVQQSTVLTQVGVTKGKFGYMSPEQIASSGLDFRSDLYNVGILLYETLTCQRLFWGENPSQFLQAMMRGDVPQLPPVLGVPPELESIMRRALSRDRDDRPRTAQGFDAGLEAIQERYGLQAEPGHVAAAWRDLFDDVQAPAAPPPPRASTAPKLLTSVSVARPAVVARAQVALSPSDVPANSTSVARIASRVGRDAKRDARHDAKRNAALDAALGERDAYAPSVHASGIPAPSTASRIRRVARYPTASDGAPVTGAPMRARGVRSLPSDEPVEPVDAVAEVDESDVPTAPPQNGLRAAIASAAAKAAREHVRGRAVLLSADKGARPTERAPPTSQESASEEGPSEGEWSRPRAPEPTTDPSKPLESLTELGHEVGTEVGGAVSDRGAAPNVTTRSPRVVPLAPDARKRPKKP